MTFKKWIGLAVAGSALLAVAGCVEADMGGGMPASSKMPSAAEQACLRAVTATTNNPDVVLLGSEFSQAGTYVRVGVGPARAPWSCVASDDGKRTWNIMSMTDEGAL